MLKNKKLALTLVALILTVALMFSCVSVSAETAVSEPENEETVNLYDFKTSFSTEKWLDNNGWSCYPYVRTADATVGVFDESNQEYTLEDDYGTKAWFKSNFISADFIHTSGQAVTGIVFEAPKSGLVNVMQSFDITGKVGNIYKFAVYKAKAETTEEGKIQDADILSTVYPVGAANGSFTLTTQGTYEVLEIASNGTAKINIDEIVEVEAGEKIIFVIARSNTGGGAYDKFMFDEFKVAYIDNVYDYKADFSLTQWKDNIGWNYYPAVRDANLTNGIFDESTTEYTVGTFGETQYWNKSNWISKDGLLFTGGLVTGIVYEAPKDGFIKVRHSFDLRTNGTPTIKYGIFKANANTVENGKIQDADINDTMVYPANTPSGTLNLIDKGTYDVVASGQSREVDEVVKVKAGEKIIFTFARASGTGITYLDFNELKISYLVSGDVNGDYETNANDLVTVRNVLLNAMDSFDFVDVNVDRNIDIKDLVRLKKIIANK